MTREELLISEAKEILLGLIDVANEHRWEEGVTDDELDLAADLHEIASRGLDLLSRGAPT